ncbi:hypothetical protein [Corynebacterium sp. DNF00584]|uniref:hypothetical protein n=1 Tax=Corynebacterium sp. DNF00584 TaxID=1384076 RepID=UPI00082FEC73|nr:hypothetical protein [Corynebacterium sp. DNF00584]
MPIPTTNPPTAASRLQHIAQLEDQLDRRWRFEVALVALTIIGTVAFMFIIGAPPVTYNPANVCTGSL